LLATALAGLVGAGRLAAAETFHQWALKPPMGWNSWDCFATTVTETQTKAQADYMAEKLKPHGWEYIVVDIQWYEPKANSFNYRRNAELVTDEYGRLLPATNRFPSAMNGVGFKALADYVHGKGLKFGIHLMRGIPRQAVRENTPIKGTNHRARDIANTNSICTWNPDMFGVDMSKPGAQAYYDSVFELIASWGVDYVKVDDIGRPYHANEKEIEAVRRAIDRTGRPMVLSLSPGETALTAAGHVMTNANLWRISDDFWDNWPALHEQFRRLRNWNPHRGPGHWPDADMLPLGVLDLGRRQTRFTPDEQYTLMTLWSIARSPLMHGGDMTKMDDFTLSLLTNDEVLAVNQNSAGNRELFHKGDVVAWVADVPDSPDRYLALFNAPPGKFSGTNAPSRVTMDFTAAGFIGKVRVRDLWQRQDLREFDTQLAPEIPAHGAKLYRLSGTRDVTREEVKGDDVPATAFLFSYFVNNGEDGLHLAWSRDGYEWGALNAGRSYLKPEVGESKLMRDPCLLRRPDGTFHMVWTTAWQGKTIGYSSSKDLITWTPQRAIPVMAQEPAAINCWAPEIVWDDKRGEFLIFWATTITNKFLETAAGGDERYNHRMYATTTRDFKTFTSTRLFYDPGFNVIDATILPAHGRFHLVIKDETRHPVKKHLRIASSDDITGPYQNLSTPFTRDWVEGPTALQVDDAYLVYYDAYRDHRYEAKRSRDLRTWEDITGRISFPRGARHGTALAVPGAVINTLLGQKKTAANLPTLFLIGDSTVKNGSERREGGLWGWGESLAPLFDTNRIRIVNRAIGGRSSRTFYTEGRWDRVMEELRPDDFVMMQFGHNDGGGLGDARGRASIKGTGDETQEARDKDGKLETVHSYGWYLRQYLSGTKAKGATPIVLSPIPRNIWRDGKVARAANDYGKWARESAAAGDALFVDLNELIARRYEAQGSNVVAAQFFTGQDHTHTTKAGAELNATCVAEGVSALAPTDLRKFLRTSPAAP
jgi:lysophospholipase L1-like esterase